MNDLFHVLPSLSISRAPSATSARTTPESQQQYLGNKHSQGALPAHALSRLIRGANSYLSSRRNDGPGDAEREKDPKVEERKQILTLRMKNVSRANPVSCHILPRRNVV